MSSTSILVTAEQLWNAPHDGLRRELVRGEIVIMNPSGGEHGDVIYEIVWLLGQHVRQHDLGRLLVADTGFVLSRNPDTVRAPDVAFICRQRVEQGGIPKTFISGAPDLAVEVVSPSDRAGEVRDKIADWLNHGTQVVWVVDPRQSTVSVHRPGESPQVLGATDFLEDMDLLAGFKVRVGEFFVTR